MDVRILPKDEYKSSTVTMATSFDRQINTKVTAEYLPVVHLFSKEGERIKLVSGTRNSIEFFGINGILITSCYKKSNTVRGIRTGVMNNMICCDLQYNGKNVHLKLSDSVITSVGTKCYETGKSVFNMMLKHLNNLQENITYFRSLDQDTRKQIYDWIRENCIRNGSLLRLTDMEYTNVNVDRRGLESLLVYLDDFDSHEIDKFMEKIKRYETMENIFEGVLQSEEPKIYNSVYHISICDEKSAQRIFLHRLAPYLAEKGILVEFHNWTSEGVNICFPLEQEMVSSSNVVKEYKHRFTIHERTTMRQCSPGLKDESYKYYVGVMKLIKKFIEDGQVFDEYKSYISEMDLEI